MKKIYKKLIALAVGCAMLMTGCGGGEGTEEETTTDNDGFSYVAVTDEEGNEVTDEEGNIVTTQIIEKVEEEKELNVGFIYGGEIEGDVMAETMETARLQAEKTLGANTYYIENVLVSQFPDACAKLIEDKKCNVIVACSPKFANSVKTEAAANSSVYYISVGGESASSNLSAFQGGMYQSAYVCGMVGAFNSSSNRLGILADITVLGCYSTVNGYIQGAKELTELDTDVRLNWAWSTKDDEVKAAIDDLVAQGCDVIFTCSYSQYAIQYCEQIGVKVIGMSYRTPELAPTQYLTGCYYNFSTYLVDTLRGVRYGTASANIYREGLAAGAVRVVDLNENCKEGTDKIASAMYQLVTENKAAIFAGEIKDKNGTVRVEKGTILTHDEIWRIEWLDGCVEAAGDFTNPVTDPVAGELNIIGEPLAEKEP